MPTGKLTKFIALYGVTFAAFGVASPFLPGLLQQRGLSPSAIGLVLGLGSAIRLLSGPIGGRLADRARSPRIVLAAATAAAAVIALGYAPATGFLALALVSIAHATVLAPLTPIADALAVGAAEAPGGFDYGWVRGAGSAAFILGNVAAGQAIGWAGLGVIIWLNAGLLALAALFAAIVPDPPGHAVAETPEHSTKNRGAFAELLRLPLFARLMLVAALVGGSHALHDGFEVIRWRASGVSPGIAGLLWGESVAAEVLVFFVLGRPIIDRLGTRGAALLSAAAGVLRWGTAAQTAAPLAMAAVEPLHGLTFALLHLVCMRLIARIVPPHLAATAQAFYGTIAMGAVTAALTFACGPLYGYLGASAFWVMAALCAAALPVAFGLNQDKERPGASPHTSRTGTPPGTVSLDR